MANNKVLFRIQRFDPEKDEKPHDQDFEIEVAPGATS